MLTANNSSAIYQLRNVVAHQQKKKFYFIGKILKHYIVEQISQPGLQVLVHPT